MKITTKDYVLEMTIGEWKELSIPKRLPVNFTKDSSHKPSVVKPIPIIKEIDKTPHNRKVTNEQIRQIKDLAEQGLSNLEIAKRLDLYPDLINYWRKNTPKELYDKSVDG